MERVSEKSPREQKREKESEIGCVNISARTPKRRKKQAYMYVCLGEEDEKCINV